MLLLLLLGLLLGGLKEGIVVHDEVRCSRGGGSDLCRCRLGLDWRVA